MSTRIPDNVFDCPVHGGQGCEDQEPCLAIQDENEHTMTERDGRKGPPAGNKTMYNCTYTALRTELKTQSPRTGRRTGLIHSSQGSCKTAHRGLASAVVLLATRPTARTPAGLCMQCMQPAMTLSRQLPRALAVAPGQQHGQLCLLAFITIRALLFKGGPCFCNTCTNDGCERSAEAT
jgi:hypothetical protein